MEGRGGSEREISRHALVLQQRRGRERTTAHTTSSSNRSVAGRAPATCYYKCYAADDVDQPARLCVPLPEITGGRQAFVFLHEARRNMCGSVFLFTPNV